MLPFHLAVVTRRGDPNPMIRDPPLDQCLLKQGFVPGPGDQKRAGKLRTVICLDHPDRKRQRLDKLLQKVFCADGTVLCIHFPVCPACAFVLCCELVIFLAVYYAIAGHILYIHLNLLPWVCGRLTGLVLSRLALLLVPHKPACRSLEAAVASFVSVCADLFISQQQVAPILSNISSNQFFLFCRLLPRKVMRCAWSVLQAFQHPIISLLPFVHSLSA